MKKPVWWEHLDYKPIPYREKFLNLDSEDEGELYIGCAGGVDITATMQYKEEEVDQEDVAVRIDLGGLRGGHSGWKLIKGERMLIS